MSFVCALCNKRLDGNAVRLNKHAGVRKIKTYDLIVISLHQVYNNMKCNEGDINRYTDVLNYQFIFDHKTWLKIVTTQFLKNIEKVDGIFIEITCTRQHHDFTTVIFERFRLNLKEKFRQYKCLIILFSVSQTRYRTGL